MDEYNRSTTVLVDSENIVHLPCSSSGSKNTLKVKINPSQKAPVWATRYKFAIKQNKELYDTIYSTIFYVDKLSADIYFLLEGENAQKVSEGDVLHLKADSNGPLSECKKITVLEKESKESDFIEDILDQPVPAGVYMKVKNSEVSVDFNRNNSYSPGEAGVSNGFFLKYKSFGEGLNFDGQGNILADQTIKRGDRINLKVSIRTNPLPGFLGFPTDQFVEYNLNEPYESSSNYTDIIEWWNGDNIGSTLGTDSQGASAVYNDILATVPNAQPSGGVATGVVGSTSTVAQGPGFRWFKESGTGKIFLLIGGYDIACDFIKCEIQIIAGSDVMIFETETQDAAPDIFYESSVSYPITNGLHEGNVQNQTASLPAIINTEFQNCFAFGNGAESFKIRDSITRSTMSIGNRTSAVLEGEDFREVHRFADLTYSGVYSFNVNNLNEFNLGLLNFKSLEPSFGEIQKIFARATDILILQEDKISYVLAGKNLLSDAAAGSVVTSVPEVLGTQIARLEEYGIGDNPESFASYGYDKYFTDSKRGVVIQLKGSSYSNDQLTVISNFGLGSWFRNLFIDFPNTQKLGAYDPYMKEYVLSSPNIALPFTPVLVEGGIKQKFLVTPTKSVSYTVDLGQTVGPCTVSYDVLSITPGDVFNVVVTYNSIAYPNPPGFQVLNTAGAGSFTVNKATVNPQTATVSIVYAPPGDPNPNASLDLEMTVEEPSADTLNVFQICVSDNNDSQETIHNEYRWSSGSFNSALHSNFVSLAEGTASPLVSQYNKVTGLQGGNIVPIDGATVELISNRLQSDDFDFDSSVNNFAQLRTATLYNNTPTDIAALLAAASNVAASGSGGVFSGTFTMLSGNNNDNLYLIYDYRKPVAVTLCYSNTSADDACCTCGTSNTYYLDGPTLDKATAVYTSSALTTKATDGWYSTGGFNRKQTSGLLEINTLCSACNLACGTTLSMDTTGGFYTVNIDLGSATGAVVLDIDFKTIPDGVKVEYNGVTYNSIYSPNFGFINSPGTNPLYTGITAFDCSISGKTFDNLIDYQFNGNGFNRTGTIKSETVDPTSVFLKATGLGTCKMIIPKPAASPSTATMTIISPCDKSEIEITPACPTALSAWESYQAAPSATNASGLCTVGAVTTYYHVVVGGSAGNPGVGDIIYTDANGTTLAGAGFYSVVGAAVIQVDANGVVASTPSCVP